jgi:hypothetical protein
MEPLFHAPWHCHSVGLSRSLVVASVPSVPSVQLESLPSSILIVDSLRTLSRPTGTVSL